MESQGKISFSAAILMSINMMIGAGILYSVGPMTSAAGYASFLSWPLICIMLFPIIWSLSKVAQLFPGEGGFYHYCSSGINPLFGFIAHWGYLLGYLGTVAALAAVLRNGFVENVGIKLFQEYPILFNLPVVLFYTAINLIPLERISKIQSAATLLKITPIIMVIALIAFYFNMNIHFTLHEIAELGLTISAGIFAFWGFETCCSIGGLLKDGPKKVGPVILVSFAITGALYFLFHLGLLFIMGKDNLAAHGAIAFPKYLGLSPTWEAALQIGISGAILFSWANSILGVSLTNITNIYSLAKNNLIVGNKYLSTVNKNHRPIYAAIVHGIIFFAFVTFIDDIQILFALTNLGVITALFLATLAVFLQHLRLKEYGQLSINALSFGSCLALTYFSSIKIPNMIYTLPLIVGMAAGIVMFKIQQKRHLSTPDPKLD